MNAALQLFPGQRALLLWMFGAGTGMFLLMGLKMGMSLPKTTLAPGLVALPYFLPLFFLPLAGWMLDSDNPGRFLIALMPVCLLAPLLALASFDPLALFCLLAALRQILLLVVFTTCARLMKTHALLPLLLALAHCLHLTQLGGAFLRSQLAALPHGVFIAALVLAVATVFCLWRFRALLLKNPGLWDLPTNPPAAEASPETAPEASPEAVREKLAAFSFVFDLTKREEEILDSLLSGLNPSEIAQKYQIAENTVRRHLTSLIRKAQARSSRRLLALYAVWTPPEELRPRDADPQA